MDLWKLTAAELLEQLNSLNVTSVECVESFGGRIELLNESHNAMITTCFDQAIVQAKQIDAKRKSGKAVGALAGLPVAVKDGICTKGLRTTAGSRILENYVPPYQATVVQRLVDADAIVIGKTLMDEFAMGSSTENPHFGNGRNPWAFSKVPGGSSGGSAIAISAGMAPLALGSDTGGSIRQPASFCGITGLKPTYGRVSRYGLIAFASSLDQVGPMALTANDAALMLNVIAGHDQADSTSSRKSTPDFCAQLDLPMSEMKIGVCREQLASGVDDIVVTAIEEAIGVFEQLGAKIVDVSLPNSRYGVAAYYVIAPSEASSNLARYDGVRFTQRIDSDDLQEMYCRTRSAGFGPEVQRRVLLGTFALSSGYYDDYFVKASKVRRLIADDYRRAFESVDMILGPTTPTTAFAIGEKTDDPISMYMADVFTVSANLAGCPAISLPAGFSDDGLPIGLQLQANAFEEAKLLRAAHQFQSQTDFVQRPGMNS